MFLELVKRKLKLTNVYKTYLVNIKTCLVFNHLNTNQYIVIQKYGLYPLNEKRSRNYENSSCLR